MEIAPALTPQRHDKTAHEGHHPLSHKIMLGLGLAAAGIIVAPYLVNLFAAPENMEVIKATMDMNTLCANTALAPTGWAGAVSGALSHIPLIGETLAEGGVGAAMLSMTVGLGGAVLGRYVDKHDDGTSSIRWGRVITTAALISSALMGLPAIISGISMSLIFFGSLLENGALISFATNTLGMSGVASDIGASTLSVLGTHFVSCAAPLLSFFAVEDTMRDHDAAAAPKANENQPNFAEKYAAEKPVMANEFVERLRLQPNRQTPAWGMGA